VNGVRGGERMVERMSEKVSSGWNARGREMKIEGERKRKPEGRRCVCVCGGRW